MTHKQIIRKAQKAFEQEQYAQVIQLLSPLYVQQPQDAEVFYLLLDAYQALEDLDAAEQLILQFEKATGNAQHKLLLGIYLGRKDIPKALSASAALIAEYPDFYEEIGSLGYSFYASGYEDVFLQQLQNTQLPDYNPLLALAHYHVMVKQDYVAGMDCIRQAMEEQPDNEELPYYLESYKKELIRQQKQVGQKQLSGETEGDGVAAFRETLKLDPGNVPAQEYYLIAQICKKIPVFYWYFYKTNFISLSPYFFRAIFLLVYAMICALYYKGGKTAGATDHLQSVTLFFAALAIPRYTLVPLSVQMLSFGRLPGYHLLKKPYDFFKGGIMLLSWVFLLYINVNPSSRGFDYFICGAFAAGYVGLLELAQSNQHKWQKRLLLGYIVIALLFSILAYTGVVSVGLLFFAIAGWVPVVLVAMAIDFYQKNQQPISEFDLNGATREQAQMNRNIHMGALVVGILLTILFFASHRMPEGIGSWVGVLSFGSMLYAYTISGMTEEVNTVYKFQHGWQESSVFKWLFLLCSAGMLGALADTVPYYHLPMVSTWRWIPVAAVFFLSWAGLFVLYYRYLKNG